MRRRPGVPATYKNFKVKKSRLIAVCVALVMPAVAQPATSSVSGIDTTAFDSAMRVQDDFYGHINGRWAKNTTIPSGKG